jgi:hypothetical protein
MSVHNFAALGYCMAYYQFVAYSDQSLAEDLGYLLRALSMFGRHRKSDDKSISGAGWCATRKYSLSVSCRRLFATSRMLLQRAGSKSKATGCRIK